MKKFTEKLLLFSAFFFVLHDRHWQRALLPGRVSAQKENGRSDGGPFCPEEGHGGHTVQKQQGQKQPGTTEATMQDWADIFKVKRRCFDAPAFPVRSRKEKPLRYREQ